MKIIKEKNLWQFGYSLNINTFFIGVLASLIMIYIIFKPLDITQQDFGDVALFELNSFTLHELNGDGLVTLMKGTDATRYKNRYVVANIDYTDNSKSYLANIRADNGLYKDKSSILSLKDNVLYNREDGLIFKTSKLTYNKKTSIAQTDKKYVLYKGSNRVAGTSLKYNSYLNIVESKNVTAKYQFK